jgi:HEAT repeat protein
MALDLDHEQVRDTGNRSWTFALLDEVRSASASESERGEAFRTLAYLEDYRSVGPLTAMVEDNRLPGSVREAASKVLRDIDDTTTPERRRAWWDSGDQVMMTHALRVMERSEADIVAVVAGDDRHPLQALALDAMTFGFDQAEYQPIKIRALDHPDARVRRVAADVLLWDEPVAAEGALVRAATDPSVDVAVAAVDTLEYYPTRRVLRALADLADTAIDRVRVVAAKSFERVRGDFEDAVSSGCREEAAFLRDWVKPVADLLRWPDPVEDDEAWSLPVRMPRLTISESAVLALVLDPDGEWAPRHRALLEIAWEAFGPSERERLSKVLTTHPDPGVRAIAGAPLAAWSMGEELAGLTVDPSFAVRKSAMYSLGLVTRDPALAVPAWEYLWCTSGTTAYEALRTYVAHAPAEEAKPRLVELAQTDARESVRNTAVSCLVDLGASREIASLVPLLAEPPGVTWAVHIQILEGLRKLGLPAPALDGLAAVDNLHLVRSVIAHRSTSG